MQLDPARLRQVLLNLLGNAVKFTDKGGVRVRASRHEARGEIRIVIEDTGIGIAKEDQARLFVKFSPVDGLQITRRLKGDPATRHVPVLLATAHAMKGSKEKFLKESGADDYISKPIVSADELLARIETLISKRSHAVPPSGR